MRTAICRASLQLPDQVEDLRLDGDVERGRGLVGDEQLGLSGERPRDRYPLRHAAGKLVRVPLGDRDRVGEVHVP